jgi:hypothetical protein
LQKLRRPSFDDLKGEKAKGSELRKRNVEQGIGALRS